jgi:hypothetical protein
MVAGSHQELEPEETEGTEAEGNCSVNHAGLPGSERAGSRTRTRTKHSALRMRRSSRNP